MKGVVCRGNKEVRKEERKGKAWGIYAGAFGGTSEGEEKEHLSEGRGCKRPKRGAFTSSSQHLTVYKSQKAPTTIKCGGEISILINIP